MTWSLRIALLLLAVGTAHARGVSPYLPLHLEPEMERRIEQVLTLAGKPILTRPIAAALVWDALPAACAVDAVLCRDVERFLKRYMDRSGVAEASVSGALTDGSIRTVPNRHGLQSDSAWEASARVYWQPFDHALLTLGGVAHDEDAKPTGSLLSLGWSVAQLDVGFRDHWLSPFTDSAMLLSTEAPTMPSVTVSNYVPLTRLGIHYEVFATQMSESDSILFGDGFTAGHPKIAGLHVSIEPASGWSIGVNRIMQFGGGARGGNSIGDVLDAFFDPSSYDNVADPATQEQFGNQAAAITSRFVFPGEVPFAVYAEYAGEDTSHGENYLLGNSALSIGIDFPLLWERFDLTLEASEWQNGWYVHSVYGDGLTNEGLVIGHWGASQRVFNDGVGARTAMARLGWRPGFGGNFGLRLRTIENAAYSTTEYERGYDVSLSYSRPVGAFVLGAEAFIGRDVFGEDFSRIAAFARYAPDFGAGYRNTYAAAPLDTASRARAGGAELFVDLGANASKVRSDPNGELPLSTTDLEVAPHVGIGARRAISARQDLGVRIEYDDVDGHTLLGVRALDYRYRFEGPLALSAFLGAARYDLATPAYGLYGGVGAQLRNLLPSLDLGLDLRFAAKVSRDRLLAGDIPGSRSDSHDDISSATIYLSYRF